MWEEIVSLLSIAPDVVTAASGNLQNLGSALRSANAAAASQTTAIAAPAADEVSSAITALLGTHAQEFQALSARATAFHDDFVNLLNGGANQYVSTELANAQQTLANTVNEPAQALLGHPLIGTGQGAAGAAAANAAQTVDLNGLTINYPFGPFELSLTQTGVSVGTGGFFGTSYGSVALNTPFGSPVLFSGTGTEAITPNGVFFLSSNGNTPLFSAGGSLSGNLNLATLSPQVTGVTVTLDGLDVSFPGTLLDGIIPNVAVTGF
jgi:PE family